MKKHRWGSALLVASVLTGCQTTEPDDGEPPVLPLEESMLFDTETFPAAPLGVGASAIEQQAGLTHHAVAALSVFGINLAVQVITAVPRLTWAALVTQQAVFENGQWHWRGSRDVLGVTYSGDLAAYTEQGDVVAEVRLSSPVVSDFLWYDGRAPIGGNQGQWRVYDANTPQNPTVVATVDWAHPSAAVWTLTFTAVGGANPGDNLSYMIDGDLRTVSWYDASEDVTSGITWNAVTREGSITAANYNGGAMACWDGSLADVACP